MKSIGNEAYLDDNGQLYITVPGTPDRFDPPGMEPKPVIKATGYTFDSVPTWGWPMRILYPNNPLQFASQYTTDLMLSACQKMLSTRTKAFAMTLDEVKVGPFTRAAIRQVAAYDTQGLIVKMNAGEMANELVRYPQSWVAQMTQTINAGLAKRDTE